MQTRLPALLILLILLTRLHAQQVPSQKYTSQNGLIADRITAITQDEQGFMWFGSFFGLCRYNGIRFEQIKLPPRQQNKYVSCLLATSHKIYASFMFGGGIAVYDSGRLNSYFIAGKDSAGDNEILTMAGAKDGSLFLGNSAGSIYSFVKGKFTRLYRFTEQVWLRSMVMDKFQNLWIASDRGLFILPYPYHTLQEVYKGENIFMMASDERGKIWMGKLNGKESVVQQVEGWQQGMMKNLVVMYRGTNIAMVPFAGNLSDGPWMINGEKSLMHINREGKITNYKVPLDYSNDLNILFADRENNVWIANEPGVLKVSNFSIRTYLFDELAAGGGSLAQINDSVLWVTNSKASYTIGPGGMKKEILKGNQNGYLGNLFKDSRNNLWLSYWDGGLLNMEYRNGMFEPGIYYGSFANSFLKVQSVIEDKKGNIWVGGVNGLFRIKDHKIRDHVQPLNAAGYPVFIVALAIDTASETIWMGDNAQGIIAVHYHQNADGCFNYNTTGKINEAEGLTDSYIRSLYMDHEKTLWVGTRFGGIYKVTNEKGGYRVINCNGPAKLSCTRITAIVPEDTTALWFATCNGIYRYKYKSQDWWHFNTSDGLLNAEVFNLSIDSKNSYAWALTSEGITRLTWNTIEETAPPLVNIMEVDVLGRPDTAALYSQVPVSYSYSHNSIGFSFAGASFIDEKKIRYKYRLQGFDREWSDPVITNNVHYASLPPGNYRFEVIAANAKGQWSVQPASFSFEIVLPIYRRPWFLFMVISLAIFLIYFIRIQRLKQRYRIEQLRLNIARDLHDDIGSNLGSINLLSRTATRKISKNNDDSGVRAIFEKIGNSAEYTLEAMDDIVWSINPEKDNVEDLVIRMREFAIPLLEARNISFGFDTQVDNNRLPMHLRRNVFLIFKECIHNILKHAEATRVDILLNVQHGDLQLVIRDNGKGFNTDKESDRNGLKNMQKRAESGGGVLTLQSMPSGSTIRFECVLR